jgi:pimeloyl-ACP methyl ester carboxylesterase
LPADLAGHADDAAAALAAVTTEPAFVFGSSIGAIIALELTSRHPKQVKLAIAHEPPINCILPAEQRVELEAAQLAVETAHRDGIVPAMQALARLSGFDPADRELELPVPMPMPQRGANLNYFLKHDAPAVRTYRPDLPSILTQADRLVPAIGVTSTGTVPAAAQVLAVRMGKPVVTMPGSHNAPFLRPAAFAAALRDVLG